VPGTGKEEGVKQRRSVREEKEGIRKKERSGREAEAEEKCKGREGRYREKGAEEKRKGRGAG
jgi:hypothetical protein